MLVICGLHQYLASDALSLIIRSSVPPSVFLFVVRSMYIAEIYHVTQTCDDESPVSPLQHDGVRRKNLWVVRNTLLQLYRKRIISQLRYLTGDVAHVITDGRQPRQLQQLVV